MRIILFDGVCNLCNATVAFIIKRDQKALFRFAAMQSEAGQTLLRQYHLEEAHATLYYLRDSVCFRRSTAALQILKDLGGVGRCFYPLIFIPACIRDAVYDFISRNRYRLFGKRKSCGVPKPNIRSRFLENKITD